MVRKLFCLRLETAAMLVGWVGTVASTFSVVTFGLGLAHVDGITKKLSDLEPFDGMTKDPEDLRSLAVFSFLTYLLLNSMNLVTSIGLIIGAFKERHLWFVPWLANSAFGLIINFAIFINVLAQSIQISTVSGYILMILIAITLAFHIYVWLAIYSYYKILQGNRDDQKSLLNPSGRPTAYNKL